jgi:SAM-dependent methyltransferase
MTTQVYVDGNYLKNNSGWHTEDSLWKVQQILKMLAKHELEPQTICEVGCGAGRILEQLQINMNQKCQFFGFDISPQALELCKSISNDKLKFELGDIRCQKNIFFDLMLVIDVLEHLEDYFGFLKDIKSKSKYKLFHVPLDISVQTVLRNRPILNLRDSVGHIHYFTKETALASLKDVGYEVIDYFYTAGYVELPAKSIRNHIARIPRKIFYSVHQDLAVRILGGYSLMILAK